MTHRILLACLLLLACGLGLTAWFLTGAGGELSGSGHPSGHEGRSEADPEAAPDLDSPPESGPQAPVGRIEIEPPVSQIEITDESGSTIGFATIRAETEEPFPAPRTVGFLVQDEEGQPIPGAEITAMGRVWNMESGLPPSSPGRTEISGVTDEHGFWTIESWFPVLAQHVVAAGYVHSTWPLSDGPLATITLPPGLLITGRVLEAETLLPVVNATVHLTGPCEVCGQNEVRTDSMGGFTSGRMGVGSKIGLRTQAPGFIPERSSFELEDLESATVEVILRKGAVVWLEFFDLDTGALLPKVRVKGETRQWTDAGGRVRSSALIGEDGRRMTLTAGLSRYPTVQFTLEPVHLNPMTPVRIPMARARTVAGLISDPAGAPLERVMVRVKNLSGKDVERLWREEHRAAFSDAPEELRYSINSDSKDHTWSSGKFECPRLPPWAREVELSVAHPGYVEASWRTQLDPGRGTTWREWTLIPTTGSTSPANQVDQAQGAGDVR